MRWPEFMAALSSLQSSRNVLGLWLRESLHMGSELITLNLDGSWACEVKGIGGFTYMAHTCFHLWGTISDSNLRAI